jgi:hypothetical protein
MHGVWPVWGFFRIYQKYWWLAWCTLSHGFEFIHKDYSLRDGIWLSTGFPVLEGTCDLHISSWI